MPTALLWRWQGDSFRHRLTTTVFVALFEICLPAAPVLLSSKNEKFGTFSFQQQLSRQADNVRPLKPLRQRRTKESAFDVSWPVSTVGDADRFRGAARDKLRRRAKRKKRIATWFSGPLPSNAGRTIADGSEGPGGLKFSWPRHPRRRTRADD